MRVMFAVSDYLPHYFPMVPLGWALQAAGHEVRVVCGAAQRPHIESAGLTPVPILEDVDMLMWARLGVHWAAREGNVPADLDLPLMNPATGEPLADLADFDWDGFLSSVRGPEAAKAGRRIDAMVGFARQWKPDLVVHDILHLDGVVPARALGVPAVCHLTGPLGTKETEWGLDVIPAHFSRAYDTYGVADRGRDLISHVIDICPAAMAPETDAVVVPSRYVPYNGPGAMPAWAARKPRRPRVVVMWSNTLEHLYGPASFIVPAILDAVGDLDADVVLTVNAKSAARLEKVPHNVRVMEHCPISLLMPTADVLVHSAGAGALLAAAAAGVPQLLITFGAEYRANGRRLAATGSGLQLHGPGIEPEEIRKAVLALLEEPAYRAGGARLREQTLERPTPADLVSVLTDLAAA